MTHISRNVKLLYIKGDQIQVSDLRTFVDELRNADPAELLGVDIEKNGKGFTIEGFIKEV